MIVLQEIFAISGSSGHGRPCADIVGGTALGAAQAEGVVVELDENCAANLYGTAEVVNKGYAVFVGDEHEPAVAGRRGEIVGKSCRLFLVKDEATVQEAAVYSVLVPHGLAGKFHSNSCCGYAVSITVFATGESGGEQEQ